MSDQSLIDRVAAIIDPAAFIDHGPREVTQRTPDGKPVAYNQMSDADWDHSRKLARQTAEEIIELVCDEAEAKIIAALTDALDKWRARLRPWV